jgi:hypothetical protein
MKLATLVFLLLTVLAMGCEKTIIREVAPGPEQGRVDPDGDGTVDSGGGNCLPGDKCLEEFAFDIEERDEARDVVLPIINRLAKTHLRFAGAMLHILKERTWYLVPVKLQELPAKDVGVSFPSDQVALQTRGAVWINSNLFNNLQPQSRARLILHEVLMGLRIFRYAKLSDRCIAKAMTKRLDGSKNEDFMKAKNQCFREFPDLGGPGDITREKMSISADEYDMIRALGIKLYSRSNEVTEAELDSWLIAAGLMERQESRFFSGELL